MKKIITMLFLSLLVFSSVFATNWIKYGTYEAEEMGTVDIYFDYDATEPFALELSELRKSKNMEYSKVLELLDDEKEEVEKGFDWLVIPEIDTTEPELPNNEYFDEKEKETLGFINFLKNKVKSFLQNLQ